MSDRGAAPHGGPLLHRAGPMLAVAASFFLYAAIRAPVPGVNEPHYLTKARHFVDPDWGAGDFFLESADTHRLFYLVFGWPAAVFPLPAVAWLGRAVAHLVLALGWTRLLSHVVPGRWTPLWTAWLFLGLAAIVDLSGEWVVGGVEAKVFGYACVLLALAWAIEGRWYAMAAATGLAVGWHPLVGLWACLAGVFAAIATWIGERARAAPDPVAETTPRPTWWHVAFGLPLAVLLALPGLLPAFDVIRGGDTRPADAPWTNAVDDLSFAADFIQVNYRLAHHLDPMRETRDPLTDERRLAFPWRPWLAYTVMTVGWLVLRRWRPPSRGERVLTAFVIGAVLIALVGLAIGARTRPLAALPFESIVRRVWLLKFYWFRLADVMVPLALAATVCGLVCERRWLSIRRATASFAAVYLATLCFPGADGPVSALSAEDRAAWSATCRWIRENTPPEARFRTPDSGIAFKWNAERPEFLSIKDCPQNAAGIVEWNERLRWVNAWAREAYADERYDEREIRAIAEPMGVDYFIAWHLGPIDMTPVFESGPFRVYDLRRPENEGDPG